MKRLKELSPVAVVAGASLAFLATISAIGSWYALDHLLARTSLVTALGIGAGLGAGLAGLYFLSMRAPRPALIGVILLSSALKIGWSLVIGHVPFADYEEYWLEALRLPRDVLLLYDTKSPVSVVYYFLIQSVFGTEQVFVYVVNAVVSAFQVWLVFLTARRMGAREGTATVLAGVFAFIPSIVYFNGVVSSETPFLLFLLLALYFFARFIDRPVVGLDLIAFATSFGLTHMVRNVGLVLFLSYLAFGCVYAFQRHGKAVKPFLVGLATFLVVVSPQAALNLHVDGRLSLSSTPFSPYVLLVGTNVEKNGRWNQDDLVACGLLGDERVPLYESRSRARSMALARIRPDPLGFMTFALTVKMKQLFENEDYSINCSREYFGENEALFDFWSNFGDSYYLLLLTASSAAQWFVLMRLKRDWMLFVAPIASIGFMHLFVQVMPRYHLPFLPVFVLVLAGLLDRRAAGTTAVVESTGHDDRDAEPEHRA